jgi:hypothetical protein
MKRSLAAAYLGVSETVFINEVKSGWWPAPRRRGEKAGLLTWDRALLDQTADREAGIGTPEQPLYPSPVVSDDEIRRLFRAKTPPRRTQTRSQTS